MKENLKVIFYAAAIAVGFFLVGILAGAIDYALNKAIIDVIPASSVQWWNFFTFDHYMAWQFANNLGIFIGIYIGVAVAIFFVFIVIWFYKS